MKIQYRRRPLAAATALFLVALSAPVLAENTWTGATNNFWQDPGNWSEGVAPPDGSTDVRINSSGAPPILIGDTVLMSDSTLYVGYEAGSDVDIASLTITADAELTNYSAVIGYEAGASGRVLVQGSGTRWKNEETLIVGWEGEGALEVSEGGLIESEFVVAGAFGSSSGQISVRDAGSVMNSRQVGIGIQGTGFLFVMQGGAVNSTDAVIGSQAGPGGSATVSGPGSIWTNTDLFYVGNFGAGGLFIEDSGHVNAINGISIGQGAGSQGAVKVGGADSVLASDGNVEVGFEGTGSLTIERAGKVQNSNGSVGSAAGSQGSVLVTGSGSIWENTGNVVVGGIGTGVLKVEDGGEVSGFNGNIGYAAGSQGSVLVDGIGSLWETTGTLTVGYEGTALLAIENGGSVETLTGIVGGQAGSQGTVNVTGHGSDWFTDELTVGDLGLGTLTIANGGLVDNDAGVIGNRQGSLGTVIISGSESLWHGTYATIGNEGTGTLIIRDAGSFIAEDSTFIGESNGSQGSVTVTGAGSVFTSKSVLVGLLGAGMLTIEDAGKVDITGDGGYIGNAPGALGSVVVTGVGSTWTTKGLVVGVSGAGMLDIADGGVVEVDGEGSIADLLGSQSRVVVNGAGSIWRTGVFLSVGLGGAGALTVAAGGQVTSDGDGAVVGKREGSRGEVIVTGAGSAWNNTGELFVGMEGVGNVLVADGGTLTSGHSEVGAFGQGLVNVTGAGSNWISTEDVWLGTEGGNGMLTLADDGLAKIAGTLRVADGISTGTLNIGSAAGQTAVAAGNLQATAVELGNAASTLNFNHTGNRDGSDVVFGIAISGNGSVNQAGPGTTVLTAANTYTGVTTVSAGTLAVDGSIAASNLNVQVAGTLSGTGTVGNTTIAGTLAPGHSIGELTVQGDLHQLAGSNYEVELGANGTSDHVHVTGQATLETQANLRLLGEVSYVPGTRYTMLTADGGITGRYALANQGMLSAFLQTKPVYDANHAYLDLVQSRSFAAVGQTQNQIATAQGVEGIGSGHDLFDTVLVLPDEAQARDAFDQLSGEAHASVRGALLEQSRDLRDAIGERVQPGGGSFWVQGLGAWGHLRGDGNAAQLESDRNGVLLGADWALGETGYIGAAAGYGKSSFDVAERRSDFDADSLHAGVYGGVANDRFGLQAGLGYTQHDVDGRRRVGFAGFNDDLQADYQARTTQAFVRGEVALSSAVSGFAEAAQVQVKSDGFQERGGQAALRVDDGDTKASYATVGLKLNLPANESGLHLRGSLGWRHSFGSDDAAEAVNQFGTGPAFTVYAPQLERGRFVGEVGLAWALGKAGQLSLDYAGTAGGGAADSSVQARYALQF